MNKNDLGKVQHHSYFSAIQSLDDNIVRAIVVPEPPIYPYKARALYSYKAKPGDPFEMGFVKGEVLDIADHKKRWWQVRKQDGTTGMAPSNYLQLI
ncbi:hypothetical protein BKA57DRAFT_399582 [Linnemannia elongata]|nr:hypothetical protein BKA57DRAFT_399582 [Linnemannia elongata]